MTRQRAPELDVIEQGKQIPAVPAAVRARVLTRARATAALAGSVRPPRSRLRPAMLHLAALVAATVFGMGIAGAVVLLRERRPPAPPREAGASAQPTVRPALSALAPPPQSSPPPPPANSAASAAEPRPSAKSASPRESYAAELELLRRAQAAYGGGDFSGSLVSLNEHARQFPNGRLAEEREALRVSCLKGLGRSSDARRAAASFAQRFPHSVLLSRTTAPETAPSN